MGHLHRIRHALRRGTINPRESGRVIRRQGHVSCTLYTRDTQRVVGRRIVKFQFTNRRCLRIILHIFQH